MRYSDKFWEQAFEELDIDNQISKVGYYLIDKDYIKTGLDEKFEPRLVTKFDTSLDLPQRFREKESIKYSILPYSKSGTYSIVPFDIYKELDVDFKFGMKIHKLETPDFLITVNKEKITSEANAINMAHISGMFHHFLDEDKLYSTVSGRMRSKAWSYKVTSYEKSIELHVDSTQMEIDGSLESKNTFTIIEAKNKVNKDFLVRQLYFPYRDFYEKIGTKKRIRNVFMIYNSGIYILLEYIFKDPYNISSIELVNKQYYTIGNLFSRNELIEVLEKTSNTIEPLKVFPQANDLYKVLNALEIISNDCENEEATTKLIARAFSFHERQGAYYKQALCFLGLVTNEKYSSITKKGELFLRSDFNKKIEILIETLASDLGIREIIYDLIILDKDFVKSSYEEYFLGKYKMDSVVTVRRRLDTIRAWVEWLKSVIE